MRWPWNSKREIERLGRALKWALEENTALRRELKDWQSRRLSAWDEVDELRAKLKEATDHQGFLGTRVHELSTRGCRKCLRRAARNGWLQPTTPYTPSKSDPAYDAAIAASLEEDSKKGKP